MAENEIEAPDTVQGDEAVVEEESAAVFIDKGTADSDEEPEKQKPKPKEEKQSDVDKRLSELEKENKRLGYALRKAQTSPKEEKKPQETLTDDQLKTIIKEHHDDPDVMLNVTRYLVEQGAQKQLDVKEHHLIQKQADQYVYQRWPELADESSNLYSQYQEVAPSLRLKGHPMEKYLTMCSMVTEGLQGIKQAEYERGKADGLAEKAEKAREKNIKTNILTPSGKKQSKPAVSEELTGTLADTAKQMGLTPSQRKIYASFLKKG